MEKTTYIYALTEPGTTIVKYVGKTDRPAKRLRDHVQPSALAVKCRRTSWLRGLLNKGQMPGMAILEVVPVSTWKTRECYWIAFYRALGVRLVNTAEGGSGGMRSEWITDQMRANMSASKVGIKRSEESVRKQAETLRGIPRRPEVIAKMSAAHKGKRPSSQCEEARLKAITGSKHSAETKAKMGQSRRGNMNAAKHTYIATAPDGTEHVVERLAEFCAQHGLGKAHMNKVANGVKYYQQHKGWKCRFA